MKIRKLFKVEMAHQLSKAYSKCCSDTIHGHSYTIEVVLEGQIDEKDGMVVDFGEVKDKIGKIVLEYDHALLMPLDMPDAYLACLSDHNTNLMVVEWNPTAENMARQIFQDISEVTTQSSSRKYSVSAVRVHETTTGWAEYSVTDALNEKVG